MHIGDGTTHPISVTPGSDFLGYRMRVLPDRDSDADGYLDWEEHLRGTDPQRPDLSKRPSPSP